MTNLPVNFFWRGDRFFFLENIVVKSHIKVGHEPIIWLSGKEPNTSFWNEIKNKITIKNADTVYDVSEFLSSGGNLRTAADLWRFNFLYQFGGLYCDTDAFALKKFPDSEWILSSSLAPKFLSIGVIKAPRNHEIFRKCISKIKKDWGNVQVFTNVCMEFFGHTNPTHENELFYPYKYQECNKLFSDIEIPKSSYSVHFYTYALESYLNKKSGKFIYRRILGSKNKDLKSFDEKWCEKNPNTLLARLLIWLKEKN